MLRFRSLFPALVAAAILTVAGYGQRYTSPPATSSITIAGKKITVEYYAPSAHGRKIMGGLVPFDEVWCTGANVATGLTTEADLEIGNLRLPKGTYSIWTIPNLKEWTLIINKESGQFHLDYNASLDFGRTRMTVKSLAEPVETLKVQLANGGGNKGTLALLWENTEASVPLTVLP